MISAVRKLLILGLILLILLSIAIYVVSKTDKTISRVDVVSNDGLVYVSKQDLINKVDKLSSKEWFDVNTESIEKYFQSFKGVDYTLVKKVWPSTLVIYLYDHKPIAYWNNNKILLDNMDIITPQVFSYDGELPYIESNDDDSQDYVYQVYQELNNIAKQNNTKIVKVYYQGNQFSLLFDNNIKVILGSKKLRSRLELFFNSYQKVKDYQSAEYFDMRYSDGFAVKYR